MALADKVKDIIVEQLGVNKDQVVPEASFIEDLGADSLDLVDLVMELEDEFSIQISDNETGNFKTIDDVVSFINTLEEK